jgi:scyllo-inositol 2-dehydrogenase (NADP+)
MVDPTAGVAPRHLSTDRPVRTAVVGYGLAGSVFHAPLVSATDGLALSTVVTSNPDRAAAARERYPDIRVVASVDELLAGRGVAHEIDLVVVASPNASHVPVALAAIRAGHHVVVDKPVAATVAAAVELRDEAAAAGVLLSVFHNRRFDGDALTVRDLLDGGQLGTVWRFESRYERWRPQVKAGAWREHPDPAAAGGLLYDLGSHLIDQALTLFGPVSTVYAELRALRPGAEVDDDAFVALSHVSGVCSHLWASSVAADLGPRFRVLGSEAAYVKYGLDVQEQALRDGHVPGEPDWGVEPESAWGRLGTPERNRPVPTRPGSYQDYYAGVRDALLGRGPVPVTIDQAIDVLAVIEAARRSARSSTVLTL